MPGGYGGMDIYVSHRTHEGWTPPQNMGAEINTEGNEVFPSLFGDVLFFASDGLPGLGGLDVYRIGLKDERMLPVNMGHPVNSAKDDFGLILNQDNRGFFTSNRAKEGKDHLYNITVNAASVSSPEPALASIVKHSRREVAGHILHIKTRQPVPGATVYVLNQVTGEEQQMQSDNEGAFTFGARLEDLYSVMGEKGDLNAFVVNFNADSQDEVELLAASPEFNRNVIFEVTVSNESTGEPVKLAKVTMFQGDTELTSDFSSLRGKVYLNGRIARDYRFRVQGKNVTHKEHLFSGSVDEERDTISLTIPVASTEGDVAALSGQIVEKQTGKPLPLADVYFLNLNSGEGYSAVSDKQGEFEITAPADDLYVVTAEKGALSVLIPNVTLRDPIVFQQDRIRLQAARPWFESEKTIVVQVVDAHNQKPLKLARVTLKSPFLEERNYTGAEGQAYFTVGGDQRLYVDVYLKNFEPLTRELIPGPEDTLRLSIPMKKFQNEFVRVAGYIYDEKTKSPLAGASIDVLNGVTGEVHSLTADEGGNFEFNARYDDYYFISGEKDGKSALKGDVYFSDKSVASSRLALPARDITFGKGEPGTTTLEVYLFDNKTNEPVNLADVQLTDSKGIADRTLSGVDGSARFSINGSDAITVVVDRADYEIKEQPFVPGSAASPHRLEIGLQKLEAVAMKGSLRDPQTLESLGAAQVHVLNETTGSQQTVLTDDAGIFEFSVSPRHSYTFLGEKDGKSALVVDMEGEVLARKSSLELAANRPYINHITIVASVADKETGEPLKLAEMRLTHNVFDWQTAYSALNGTAIFKDKPGEEYLLDISLKGYEPATVVLLNEFPLVNDTIKAHIQLKKLPENLIQPAVVYAETTGKPLPAADVFVMNEFTGEAQDLKTNTRGYFGYRVHPEESYGILVDQGDLMAFMINVKSPRELKPTDTLEIMAVKKVRKNITVLLSAADLHTGEPVKMVSLQISDEKEQDPKARLMTGADGTVSFLVRAGEAHMLHAQHAAYLPETFRIATSEASADTLQVVISLEPAQKRYTSLHVNLYDDEINESLPHTEVSIAEHHTGGHRKYLTDEKGDLELKVEYGGTYSLYYEGEKKKAVISGLKIEEASSGDKISARLIAVDKVTKEDLKLTFDEMKIVEVMSGKEQLFVTTNGTIYEYTSLNAQKVLLNKREKKVLASHAISEKGNSLYEEFLNYTEPSAITSRVLVKNIHYDFDSHDLSQSAREELKKIADVMKEHEDLKLSLKAYADNRGSGVYNRRLTEKRAHAALNYLLSSGIAAHRIDAAGMGHEYLAVPCPIPEDCSEEEHLRNRRAEFILFF